jgi:hypothetical protein
MPSDDDETWPAEAARIAAALAGTAAQPEDSPVDPARHNLACAARGLPGVPHILQIGSDACGALAMLLANPSATLTCMHGGSDMRLAQALFPARVTVLDDARSPADLLSHPRRYGLVHVTGCTSRGTALLHAAHAAALCTPGGAILMDISSEDAFAAWVEAVSAHGLKARRLPRATQQHMAVVPEDGPSAPPTKFAVHDDPPGALTVMCAGKPPLTCAPMCQLEMVAYSVLADELPGDCEIGVMGCHDGAWVCMMSAALQNRRKTATFACYDAIHKNFDALTAAWGVCVEKTTSAEAQLACVLIDGTRVGTHLGPCVDVAAASMAEGGWLVVRGAAPEAMAGRIKAAGLVGLHLEPPFGYNVGVFSRSQSSVQRYASVLSQVLDVAAADGGCA